ncbi:MAG: PT domain-containing protein, partial [Clostridia bacterium]|nr:PT domain-containing protein [Clostridia bacterium]
MCNDLFDCVDKKSETKEETYYYDYTILTSQNLEDAEINNPDNTSNYELSDNGVCPKDCQQCQKNNKCTKCRNNYNLVSSTENNGEIKCSPESELATGYYVLNNIYYKCMDNCDSCKDGKTCDKCSNGLAYNNGKCIKGFTNCETYTKDDKCQKCKSNYGLKEDDRTSCLSISNLENYYTKDGISYYPCDKEIQNCSKCYYNETQSKVKCYLCTNNLLVFESESCLSESNLNSTLYKKNSTHINKCSNAINNCNECISDKNCTKCVNNYYMVNDNKMNCIQSSNIPKDQYYLSQDQTMYYACNNSDYNDILNCKSCSDKTSCSLFQDGYTFIDGDKSTCVEITSLNNKYILDPQDKNNYIKCTSLYSNCDTCNNLKCLTCNDDYTIFNDNCVSKSSLQTNSPTQTDAPTTKLTDVPITKPTDAPTNKPTEAPTNKPTDAPTNKPTEVPVIKPTDVPSNKPTDSPMIKPTEIPSNKPSESPTIRPIDVPTNKPTSTDNPTNKPTNVPTNKPTDVPTNKPTDAPLIKPTDVPTNKPTEVLTNKPIDVPSNKPTEVLTNTPINPPTNVQTNTPTQEITNKPSNAPPILPTNEPTISPIDIVSKDIAEQKANITLSFEKINNFNYAQDKKTINFDLSILTQTGEINKGDEIITYVNLIYTNGTRQSSNTEAKCTTQDITEGTSSVRAKFSCTIENLEGDYYSLRYNYSTNISGTPNDEISLDPVMTTKYKSSSEEKIIPTFTPISINHTSCQSTGIFTILGNLTEKLSELNKFIIPLTYPEGITLSCELNQLQNLIECKADREIINKMIIIEQTIIKQGTEDYFNLKSIKSQDELICSNSALKDSVKKENSTISFRQVSHFENSNNEISFYLISLVSEKLDKGKNITINVNINENEEKPINCILEDSINPQQGQTQGNFLCSVNKNQNELWKNVNYQNISVSVSPNNDIISGVDSLDETSANPSKTDDEIEKIKEKKQNNETVNSLTEVVDYYSENVEVNTLTLNNINMDSCNTTGQLTLT